MTDTPNPDIRRLAFIRLRNFMAVGDTPIEVAFGRRLTLIYGGNGVGKSAVLRALEQADSGGDLEARRQHGLDGTREVEVTAGFVGTACPALDVPPVELPIEEITTTWGPGRKGLDGGSPPKEEPTCPRSAVEVRLRGGRRRRWVFPADGVPAEVDVATEAVIGPASPPTRRRPASVKALARDLRSRDPGRALEAVEALGGVGRVVVVREFDDDWRDSSDEFQLLPSGFREFSQDYLPGDPTLVPAWMDLVWSLVEAVLPGGAALELEAWRDDRDRDEFGPLELTEQERLHVALTWKLPGGGRLPRALLSTGEDRVKQILLRLARLRLEPQPAAGVASGCSEVPVLMVLLEEPEAHLHASTQGALLRAMVGLDDLTEEVFRQRMVDPTTADWPGRPTSFPRAIMPLVIETHSEALLRAALDLVERGELDPEVDLAINVIERDEDTGEPVAIRVPVSRSGSLLRLWPGAWPGGESGAPG